MRPNELKKEIMQARKNVPNSKGEGRGIDAFVSCFETIEKIDFSIKSNVCFNLYASPRNIKATSESYAGYFGYGEYNRTKLNTKKVQELIGRGKILQIDCSEIRTKIVDRNTLFMRHIEGEVKINLLNGNEKVNTNNIVYYCKKMHFGTERNSDGEQCVFENYSDVVKRYIELLTEFCNKDIYTDISDIEEVYAVQIVLPYNSIKKIADESCLYAIILVQQLLIEALSDTVFGYEIPEKIALGKVDRFCHMLANIINKYEVNEITPKYIEQWAEQFGLSISYKAVLLEELIYIFKHKEQFVTKDMIIKKLEEFFVSNNLGAFSGEELYNTIRNMNFLNIQDKSQSQKALLELTNVVLGKYYNGLTHSECKSNKYYIYIDDVAYTGTSVIKDVAKWLANKNIPKNSKILIYIYAVYTKALRYIRINKIRFEKKYGISIDVYYSREIFNYDKKGDFCKLQVIKPTFTQDKNVMDYVTGLMKHSRRRNSEFQYNSKLIYRKPGLEKSKDSLFKNSTDRDFIEKAFLKQGVKLAKEFYKINNPGAMNVRPLGFNKQLTLGFGATLVTYRNIANNCPMVLWFESSNWKPLFRREDPYWKTSVSAEQINTNKTSDS